MTTTGADLVPVTIDGIELAVPRGTLLIRAAEDIGIAIPRFCDHPLLDPAGACRQCLVEVTDMGNGRGLPKPATACTTTVLPGMVIKTQLTSVVADKAQQGVMEQLLINHPLDCPMCDKGGECPLQNQAMSNGRGESRFRDVKRTWRKPVAISGNILLDRERCISCLRCVRFADEIAGDPLIGMFERGWRQEIATSVDYPFDSYFSGNTVQICPVGALTGATYRFRSRPFDLRSTPTICEHCASGCELRADWRRGKITRRLSGNDPEVNEEWNCDKGRFAFQYAEQPDRLRTPMLRDESGQLVPVGWPEALERAAEGLAEARDRGGIGVLPGGRLTEEDAYAYAKFARVVLGTNDIDYRARPHSDEELAFLAALPYETPDRGGVTYADLERAETVLLIGFEPEDESPIVFTRLRKATRRGATKVWSVAPLASRGLQKLGGTLIPALPGQEAATIAGLDPALGAGIVLVGERLATSPGALSAARRFADANGGRLAWVPRRAGERGAIDAGALPTLLPGGRPVADAAARAEVERAWHTDLPATPGRDLTGILTAARDGGLAALLVGAVDPADLPDPALATAALNRVGFLVSLELRASAITERADVVLPVAPVAEKAGRFVDWEGRRRPFDLTLTNTGQISDGRVLDALADELDIPLGLANLPAARAELHRLGLGTARPPAPDAAPAPPPRLEPGQALLATWAETLDAGRGQDGEENLADTARSARALLSANTAAGVGVSDEAPITISTARGAISVPALVTEMADGVVWLPTNARGCAVRATLGAVAGDTVQIAAGGDEQ